MSFLQILLRNRSTNLNAKTHDGITPMILAARLAIEGLVEELINADADINAMDENGKIMKRNLYCWLLLVVLGLTALLDSISVYIGPSPREREKDEK